MVINALHVIQVVKHAIQKALVQVVTQVLVFTKDNACHHAPHIIIQNQVFASHVPQTVMNAPVKPTATVVTLKICYTMVNVSQNAQQAHSLMGVSAQTVQKIVNFVPILQHVQHVEMVISFI